MEAGNGASTLQVHGRAFSLWGAGRPSLGGTTCSLGRGCLTSTRPTSLRGGKGQILYGRRVPALLTHGKHTLKTGWPPTLGTRSPTATCHCESFSADRRDPLWKDEVLAAVGTGIPEGVHGTGNADNAVLLRRWRPPTARSPCMLSWKGKAHAGDPGGTCPCWDHSVQAGAGPRGGPRVQ